MSAAKEDRNLEIYNKKLGLGYEKKYTYRELSLEYNLSISAVYLIMQRLKIKELEAQQKGE